jgi:hypothetical protein
MYKIFLRFRPFMKGEKGYVKISVQEVKCEGVNSIELGNGSSESTKAGNLFDNCLGTLCCATDR